MTQAVGEKCLTMGIGMMMMMTDHLVCRGEVFDNGHWDDDEGRSPELRGRDVDRPRDWQCWLVA